MISMLQGELDAKNKLIDEQQQTINKLTDSLAAAQQTAQAAQALHAGTMQKQLSGSRADQNGEKPKSFLSRLFGN
jgi:hypothetical protein